MSKDIAVADQGSNALMVIINRAVSDPAFDVAKLEALLNVKERWEREEARKAFVVALTAFKANPPDIFKNKQVAFKDVRYSHATLDNVSIAIGTALAEHGLSHRWSVDQAETRIKVTCILMHNAGHSESLSMQSASDQSGNKNAIQALGSAVTYLERYTLLAITGMAVQDDDGASSAPPAAPIAGPKEAKPAPTQAAAPTDPVEIKPAKVGKNKAGEFVVPTEGGETYYSNSEPQAKQLQSVAKAGGTVRVMFEYRDGRRFVTSVDA